MSEHEAEVPCQDAHRLASEQTAPRWTHFGEGLLERGPRGRAPLQECAEAVPWFAERAARLECAIREGITGILGIVRRSDTVVSSIRRPLYEARCIDAPCVSHVASVVVSST